jgi:hypothetical protein
MFPKLTTPLIELNLGDYSAYGASIGYCQNVTTFTFIIGPISDATLAALDDVVQSHGTIRLYCCREPMLFDPVGVERKGPRKAQINGRIVRDGAREERPPESGRRSADRTNG